MLRESLPKYVVRIEKRFDSPERILELIEENGFEFPDVEILDPKAEEMKDKCIEFGKLFFEKRKRKGFTEYEATKIMRERNYFGSMMVEVGEVGDA